MSGAFRGLQMRTVGTLRRNVLRSSSLGGIRTKKTTTVLVTSNKTTPEDIVNECQKIRESIQALNDVSRRRHLALPPDRRIFSLLTTLSSRLRLNSATRAPWRNLLKRIQCFHSSSCWVTTRLESRPS